LDFVLKTDHMLHSNSLFLYFILLIPLAFFLFSFSSSSISLSHSVSSLHTKPLKVCSLYLCYIYAGYIAGPSQLIDAQKIYRLNSLILFEFSFFFFFFFYSCSFLILFRQILSLFLCSIFLLLFFLAVHGSIHIEQKKIIVVKC